MKRIAFIVFFAYLFFLLEFVLYNAFGNWGKPEFLVLLVVFCSLYWGIRYSIIAALAGGLIKDAFSIEPFGTYLFIYVSAAFLTTLVRRNFYQPGSRVSRVLVVFAVVVGCFTAALFIHLRQQEVRLADAVGFILAPQLITTMIAATFVFQQLRGACAKLKL